jgi:hypothetical protein
MRIAALAFVSVALVSAGVALATPGPPQPPQPVSTSTTPTPISPTGLVGYVSRGPITPNCAPGNSCFRPARVMLRFSRPGQLVTRAPTRVTGAYRIALAPGIYSVSVAAGLGRLKPSLVRVPADRWRHVNFTLGTGIY